MCLSWKSLSSKRGGPAKHLHYDQDEWFYALEGDLLIEAGDERFRLKPGDALFVKKTVPHVWANVGGNATEVLSPGYTSWQAGRILSECSEE